MSYLCGDQVVVEFLVDVPLQLPSTIKLCLHEGWTELLCVDVSDDCGLCESDVKMLNDMCHCPCWRRLRGRDP